LVLFLRFWQIKVQSTLIDEAHPRFAQLVRERIATELIAPTFRSLPISRLNAWLGVSSESELSPLLEKLGWTVEKSSAGGEPAVHLPPNAENDPKERVQRETVELDRLSRLLKQSQVAVL
jgi:CSN8/PSMD8/EIF3K family